jgi:hypothetical protein
MVLIFGLQNQVLYAPLAEIDPEVQNIIDKETWRQFTGLELIASEVCHEYAWAPLSRNLLDSLHKMVELDQSRNDAGQRVYLDQ